MRTAAIRVTSFSNEVMAEVRVNPARPLGGPVAATTLSPPGGYAGAVTIRRR